MCSGIFDVTSPIVMKFPTFGNAEFVDGYIYLTLSVAGIRNGVMGNDMYKVVLTPSDLNGTVEGIGVYKVEIPASRQAAIVELTTGTVSHKTCP